MNKDQSHCGYAFFEIDKESVIKITNKPHMIGKIVVNCKIAAQNGEIPEVQKDEMERKIFVGNVHTGCNDLDLYKTFEKFGPISKAYLVRNRNDGSYKNFGFVVFDRSEDMNRVLSSDIEIKCKGKRVSMRKAVDRQTQKTIQLGSQMLQFQFQQIQKIIETSRNMANQGTKKLILSHTYEINESPDNYRLNGRHDLLLNYYQLAYYYSLNMGTQSSFQHDIFNNSAAKQMEGMGIGEEPNGTIQSLRRI